MRERLINEILVALKREYESTKSVKGFRDRLALILDEYEVKERSTDIVPYNPVPKALETYLVTRVIEGLSRNTAEQYKLTLVNFFLTLNKDISQIDTNDIRKYLYMYKRNHNVQDRYINWIRGILSTFFRWCVDNEYLVKNPAASISVIKYSYNRKDSLTQEELEEMRDKCNSVRERVIVEVLYSTGMRTHELCDAKVTDLDMSNRTIVIYNQKGKRYKTCYLNEKAIYWLKKYLPLRKKNEWLIQAVRSPYKKLENGGVECIIKSIASRTNITKNVTPSTFRHTTATQGLNNGMSLTEVQTILDHKSPETTLIYADRYSDNIQQSHRKAIV